MFGIMSIFWNASTRLVNDGGLANAGNIALSLLLSLFPFMILIATFVDIWGEPELLEEILILMFDNWPAGSAGPIAEQMKVVLGQASGLEHLPHFFVERRIDRVLVMVFEGLVDQLSLFAHTNSFGNESLGSKPQVLAPLDRSTAGLGHPKPIGLSACT